MKVKLLVVLCWAQLIVAAGLVLLYFYSSVTRPAVGFEFSRRTGAITSVVPGSAAERAGLRAGDRIIRYNGHGTGLGVIHLYFKRAGEPVPLVIDRDGVVRNVNVVADTIEQLRRDSLRSGISRVLWAINGYLTFPLHAWMLALATALLVLRPSNKDARLAALVFTYWAGGLFLFDAPGFGAVIAAWPAGLRGFLYLVVAAYIAAFFAACVHFALVFPSDRVRWRWVVAPYLVALPIFLETARQALQRYRNDVEPPDVGWIGLWYATLGPLMLIVALVILVYRFRAVEDANISRRMKLIFLSLLPGTVAFTIATIIDQLSLGYAWTQTGRMLNTIGTFAGSGIFAYAVVRHRMFNVRVLVRRSIQYALAKGTLVVIMALPLLGLALFLYAHRDDSLAALLTREPALYLLVILPLIAVIRYRKRLLEALDRRYFREQYDARKLLLQVVSMIRGGSDMFALSQVALDEIDRALHPRHIALWQLDPTDAHLIRGFYRGQAKPDAPPLELGSTLISLLSTTEEPLDVHSLQTRTLIARLPDEERDWIDRTGGYLLVPLLIEHRVAGLLVLGERMSEEPYGREDRALLKTLAAQLALTIDYSRLKQSPALVWGSHPVHVHITDALRLCPSCGRCYPSDDSQCEYDQQSLVPESGVTRVIDEKYVITKLLGRGGMGSVYLATQRRLNRPVAVKVLLAHLVGSPTMRTRFEREARIVARLKHPAIVTIHDFGMLPSGHAYLVMEYLDGQTLRKTIAAGPQPVSRVLEILMPVGEAIDAAHRAGVVHRDLKPENIMLVSDHDRIGPRVLDFGLAKLTGPVNEEEATMVQSNQSIGVVGTLMYMAPEILTGHSAEPRSDQYSLGIIAYELLAGSHPLSHATDLAAVVRGHTEEAILPIRKRVPDVPVHVEEAIHRALAKDAGERFASVKEFIKALEMSPA
jgi:eukaryotic-like serine/threonine-protein kinase